MVAEELAPDDLFPDMMSILTLKVLVLPAEDCLSNCCHFEFLQTTVQYWG